MLRGTLITLDEPRPPDSAELYRWINDAQTARHSAPYRPIAQSGHDAWFAGLNREPGRMFFAIRKEGVLVGAVQLIDIDPVHRSAELIIRIGEEGHRGQGLGADAVRTAVDFAWRDLNLQRVWLRVFAGNARAIKAYERAGFEAEGVMRRAAHIDGGWRDVIIMAALRPL
jgi:RimJ/RimL family protein N-acetyltransferase